MWMWLSLLGKPRHGSQGVEVEVATEESQGSRKRILLALPGFAGKAVVMFTAELGKVVQELLQGRDQSLDRGDVAVTEAATQVAQAARGIRSGDQQLRLPRLQGLAGEAR